MTSDKNSFGIIVVVDPHVDRLFLAERLAKSMGSTVGFITPEEAKNISTTTIKQDLVAEKSFVKKALDLPSINKGQFVCNGKHVYEQVLSKQKDGLIKSDWVCQCGRNIND